MAPEYLTGVFDRLVWSGLVSVAEGDPLWELRRLSLTDAGAARYAVLGEQRQTDLTVPPAEHGSTQTPAGRRSSTAALATPGGQPAPTLASPTERRDQRGG